MPQLHMTGSRFTMMGKPAFWWPILLMIALPALGHLPEIAGWVTCNPLYSADGLMAGAPRHVLPGSCSDRR